jgi:hypothetical protein
LQRTARRYCNGVEVGACPKHKKNRLKNVSNRLLYLKAF